MTINRSHLYVPLVDEAGELLRYAQVRLYDAATGVLYTGKIYRDRQSTQTFDNPFIAAPALVSVYLAAPVRVILGVAADQSKPEVLSNPYDARPDASQTVYSVTPMYVTGTPMITSLLSATDAYDAFWHPLRIDHEHAMVAPNTVLTGRISALLAQAGDFTGTSVIGANSGGWGSRSSLRFASMLGYSAYAYGRGCVAVGKDSWSSESDVSPWHGGALSMGRAAYSQCEGVALGSNADATATSGVGSTLLGQQLSVGPKASGSGPRSVALGNGAVATTSGVAVGAGNGSSSNGPAGSVGLGTNAQYGLPSDADPSHWSVLLGAYDPSRARVFPWANPLGSQSESPWNEYTPVMSFTGRTVQLQRGLQWLLNCVALRVTGDTTLGGPGGTLGFYGKTPVAQGTVGDDEPASGITALDNLIYALRDLGLLNYRTEALMTYRAEDLARFYLDGDLVPRWGEHAGTDVAVYQPGNPPWLRFDDDDFNDHPSVVFDNGVYRRSTKAIRELRGANLLPQAQHFVAVTGHFQDSFGNHEGLFNLSQLGYPVADVNTVFMADGRTTWQDPYIVRYEMDGLTQVNRDAKLWQGPHVYRMTNRALWPHARPVIGGPRDQDSSRSWDNYSGTVAELVGVDGTWDETHTHSLTTGLMFKYGINQDQNALAEPAANFVYTQHDPAGGVYVFWDEDYDDNRHCRVYGRVQNCPKPVIFVAFISIFVWFDVFSFRGSLLGNWGNIVDLHLDYEVDISIWAGDLDGDGDIDTRVDVDVEFNELIETHVDTCSLNSNFSWTQGQRYSNYGHKVCRIRHRVTREVFCVSGCPPFRYADTEVRVYSTRSDGSLFLEGTSPLWGDGTFGVRVRSSGHKVARVYEVSTGNLLGTTEWHERALPRTTVYATDDSDYSAANKDRADTYQSALAALCFLDMSFSARYRARNILRALSSVRNPDGSLNRNYSAALPAVLSGQPVSPRGMAWTILAILRYQAVTGDGQFLSAATAIGSFLLTLQSSAAGVLNGSILTGVGSTKASTEDNAIAYFALRDLGAWTATASYTTAAGKIKTNLLANHWTQNRWGQGAGDDAENLAADVWGGLFLLAIGDRDRARATVRHLKRFRVKNATIGASHYSGRSGLVGYKPYADMGTAPYVSPPSVIDQANSWAAVLFKSRYGEPVGDDVASLMRWGSTLITNDPGHTLYGAQFLSYSATATQTPYALRARPDLTSGALGYLLSQGARYLLIQDALPAPVPASVNLAVSFDRNAYRFAFRFTWTADPSIPVAAFEAAPDISINAGQTWSAVTSILVAGQTETARDPSVGVNGYSSTWSIPVPNNLASNYRVRVRLRNATFGAWIISNTIALPTIS